MQSGTPSITSSIGAESMFENLPRNGFITDNPEDLTAIVVSIYLDKML